MRLILLAISLFLWPTIGRAGTYPERPIRVILGLSAGSGVDVLARIVAQKLSADIGQPIVIENRPGAGSNIATRLAAAAPPDGYTLSVATIANAINATLYKNLDFDVLRDFAPIILAGTSPNVLVVNPALPVHSVKDLIDLAKARPGKLTAGSSGYGTSPQMTGELFRQRADINVVHVPYKGGPEATAALMAGDIDYVFVIVPTVLAQVQAGTVRAIAVTSRERTSQLPDLPTVSESGLPDFEAVTWFGFTAPARTPPDIVDFLNREIGKVLAMPDVRRQLALQGIDPAGGTPQQFRSYMESEFTKWGRIVKDTGASVEQ
jgi:tripartite-type tricarboxylate transporter receptor subunit TctC